MMHNGGNYGNSEFSWGDYNSMSQGGAAGGGGGYPQQMGQMGGGFANAPSRTAGGYPPQWVPSQSNQYQQSMSGGGAYGRGGGGYSQTMNYYPKMQSVKADLYGAMAHSHSALPLNTMSTMGTGGFGGGSAGGGFSSAGMHNGLGNPGQGGSGSDFQGSWF